MTDQQDLILDQLRVAARQRQTTERQRAAIRAQTAVLLHQARRQGISVSRLMEAVGLTRGTIYALLHREG
jgi:hypothetical protein